MTQPARFLTALLILALASPLVAQTAFQRTFGGSNSDYGYSVAPTADSGYIITGYTWSYGAGERDVWLIKTNADGDTMWTRTFGGDSSDSGLSVAQTADGGYVITGYTWSYGAGRSDAWLIKTDTTGDTMWTRTFGGSSYDHGRSVAQTADGGYIITGFTYAHGPVDCDVWLIKTDAGGDTMWTRTFGGSGSDFGSSVAQTTDGGYIIAGETGHYSGYDWDVVLIKTDAGGDTTWTRTFGGDSSDGGYSVAQTADGGYIVTGYTESYGAGKNDVWLIKTDASGNKTWDRTFGGSEWDQGYSVAQTADNGYIVTGRTDSYGAGEYDVWLIKTDSMGRVGLTEQEQAKVEPLPGPTLMRASDLARFEGRVLDATGREVTDERRSLSPGIYFLREVSGVERQATTTRKVILTR
jgi:hypothetical protein